MKYKLIIRKKFKPTNHMNRQSKYHLKCFVRVRSLPAQHNLGSSGHFPSLTSLLIVASSLHVLTFSTLCLGRFLIRRIYGAYHSRGTYFTFNIFKTLPKRSGCHAIAAGNYLHVTRSHTASWLRDGGSSCTECERRFEKRYWLSFNERWLTTSQRIVRSLRRY